MTGEELENKNYSRLDTLPRILPLKCDFVKKLNKISKLNKRGKAIESQSTYIKKNKNIINSTTKEKKTKDISKSSIKSIKSKKIKKTIPPSPTFEGFKNIKDLKNYIEKTLLEIDICYSLKDFDEKLFDFFFKLFQFHAQKEKKRVNEIEDIQVRIFPKVNPNRERKFGDLQFWIVLKDGSCDSINWNSCSRRSLIL